VQTVSYDHSFTYLCASCLIIADQMQFEHLCLLMSDSNCILLILKFFNQDLWQYVTSGVDVPLQGLFPGGDPLPTQLAESSSSGDVCILLMDIVILN